MLRFLFMFYNHLWTPYLLQLASVTIGDNSMEFDETMANITVSQIKCNYLRLFPSLFDYISVFFTSCAYIQK